MSEHGKEALSGCLSGSPGMKLENMKFFRGTRKSEISRAEFEAELRAAAARKRSGEVQDSDLKPWK